MSNNYTIAEHQHRLAAWDAATSARASKLCRFRVQVGVEILEQCKFNARFQISDLPRPSEIDRVHKQWRKAIIRKAQKQGFEFSHGVAAKLINCYLKARFVCGGDHEDNRVTCLHPPIDALLLKGLARHNVGGLRKQWNRFEQQRWSKYDSETYQSVIDHIRHVLQPKEPLWKIEKYWEGYQ